MNQPAGLILQRSDWFTLQEILESPFCSDVQEKVG